MPIYKRKIKKGDRYWYKGQHYGIQYHSKAIYLTQKEARSAEAEKIKELDERMRRGDQNDIKLIDLANQRLDYLKDRKSLDYYKENRRYMAKLISHFGTDIMISSIRRKHIIELVNIEAARLKKAGKGNFKVNAFIRSLKALWFWGLRNFDLEFQNPVIGVEMYAIPELDKFIPSLKQIEEIKAILNPKQRLLIDFLLQSGARVGEALRLEYSHIKENKIVLYTHKAKNSNLTARIIPKPACIYHLEGKGRVFDTWHSYPRFLEEAVEKLGQPKWNFHACRHYYASTLATQGKPIIEIMQLLGHSNLSTCQRYLKFLGFNYY